MSALVYLHGFASGPDGHKGRHCRAWAEAHGVAFHAPDLNLPTFEGLTVTAQVRAVEALLAGLATAPVLVGSSLGGLVAAAVAYRGVALRHLVLLAPAFGFARRRLEGERWEGYR
ncbi:MAG TPA: YqiA/YcfP family alpha/beta fold hydrolase, partial [Holophaga sp.]|nr:YqiA/YcfP family alpha/beta fold hydrolase [Holophaga sp.]